MTTQNATALRSPSPRVCSKPLMTHLTEDERAQLAKMADAEMRPGCHGAPADR